MTTITKQGEARASLMARSLARLRMGRGRQFWRDAFAGYAMASPWLIGFILFTAGPVLLSLYYSFTFYRITTPPRWIGLNNYKVLASSDPKFTLCLVNTIYYAALSVPLSIITALILAMLMNQRIPGRALSH
ncbi:MAG: sugar ABC transporter permease, partial [Chloroflexi bacterium]|nr:sugar ABC transporter permease [Chloroflexota bacterium]